MALSTIKYDTALKNIANYAAIKDRKHMEAEAIAITLKLSDSQLMEIMAEISARKQGQTS